MQVEAFFLTETIFLFLTRYILFTVVLFSKYDRNNNWGQQGGEVDRVEICIVGSVLVCK